MTVDDDLMHEFLLESTESLNQLDQDFVALEQNPTDRERLAAIFRCVHTIKGTSGFLGLPRLEALTHAGETLLARLRDGELVLDAAMTSALLGMVDAVRRTLAAIEATGTETDDEHAAVLTAIARASAGRSAADAPAPEAPVFDARFLDVPVGDPPSAESPAREEPSHTSAVRTAPSPVEEELPLSIPAIPPSLQLVPESTAEPRSSSVTDTTIRVDVGLIDRIMNLVGELVLARNQILQFNATAKDAAFANASQRLNLLTTELQEGVMKTRMQPIGNVWNKFPRVVRDLAQSCAKKVSLELDGTETELDRTIIEAIKDPLTHAVRNAIDHGIEKPETRRAAGKPETGRLLLRAFHEGGQVNIEVSDDGKGLDIAKIRARGIERGLVTAERAARMSEREVAHLVFAPGFSTAEKVTNVSGRGVGMDVVKTNIEKIGGTVDIVARPGSGTTLRIKIPLTLAIIPALIVTSRGQRFAIPQVSLLELVRLEGENARRGIERIHDTTVYRLRGNLLPLVFLSKALELPEPEHASEVFNIVVLQADDRQFGLVVDDISDTEEIVVKPLGKELKGISTFAGATIMGDGRVALILDVLGVAQRTSVISAHRERAMAEKATEKKEAAEKKEAFLLFRVGPEGRMAIPLAMVARLEELPREDVERAAGSDVVQYRGEILPLVDLARELGVGSSERGEDAPLQVIVYADKSRRVGFVVDQILDVVEDTVLVKHRARRAGVLGSAVVQGKVTDLLDVHGVIASTEPTAFSFDEAAQ